MGNSNDRLPPFSKVVFRLTGIQVQKRNFHPGLVQNPGWYMNVNGLLHYIGNEYTIVTGTHEELTKIRFFQPCLKKNYQFVSQEGRS